jgi:hypothetical protein
MRSSASGPMTSNFRSADRSMIAARSRQAQYHGGMIDDGTVFRLGQNNFRWICGDEYSGVWLRKLAAEHKLKVDRQLANVPGDRELHEVLGVRADDLEFPQRRQIHDRRAFAAQGDEPPHDSRCRTSPDP